MLRICFQSFNPPSLQKSAAAAGPYPNLHPKSGNLPMTSIDNVCVDLLQRMIKGFNFSIVSSFVFPSLSQS